MSRKKTNTNQGRQCRPNQKKEGKKEFNWEDYVSWTARVVVRGGDPEKPMLYKISKEDKDRVERNLYDAYNRRLGEDTVPFICFDTADRSVAINLDHLVFWQSLFDALPSVELPRREPDYSVDIYLAGVREPMRFSVDEDHDPPGDDDDLADDRGQCRNLLYELDTNPEKDSYVYFTDIDGEVAFFHVREIAVLEVSRQVTEAELRVYDDDEPAYPVEDPVPSEPD